MPISKTRALDTVASNNEVWPQPAPPGCGFSTSPTPKAFGAVSPEDVLGSVGQGASCSDCQLEGEVETAAKHSEIVLRSIDHAEAQVVSPTDMPRETDFETGSELT